MKCPNCGKISPDGAKVCMMCGTPFANSISEPHKNQERLVDSSGDHVVSICKRHWTAYCGRVLIAILLFFYGLQSIPYKNWFDVIFSLVVIIVIVICTILSYKNDCLILTESKITGHIGVIRTRTLTTPISKVQNIGYSNGIMGKILGYHTVTIDNAGSGKTEFIFKHAAKAVPFVNAVQKRI